MLSHNTILQFTILMLCYAINMIYQADAIDHEIKVEQCNIPDCRFLSGLHCTVLCTVVHHSTSLSVRTLRKLFNVFYPHSRFLENFQKVIHLITTSSQTRLTMKFLK
ncbi:hypothetical protein GYH30_016419 [Glycine max]|uniref:Secreted protein n=1 Tax=Glycine max TaxID=3847 RepID=A0A0R0JM76_SOYBN|nr:hypothetical protein GYH30_016419 [Glycine max]